jgi:pimeloyl-ACP methyl ester carboxylesterase
MRNIYSLSLGVVCLLIALAGCGGSGNPGGQSPAAPASSPSALPRIHLPVKKGETVEGLVDVAGHDVYARCSGTGSPTVVYFTGWAPDPSKYGVSAIQGIEAVDGGKHRICSYERRNTGRSEKVKGTPAPEDVIADVDGVLDALGEHGPFILLGASFGGLIAGAYAVAYPNRTSGILLLDSSIPDDYVIDKRNGFDGMCLKANRQADAYQSLEKIDNCRLSK